MKFLKELIRKWQLKRLWIECDKEHYCPIHEVTYLAYGRCEQCWRIEGENRRAARREKLTGLQSTWQKLNPGKPGNCDTK